VIEPEREAMTKQKRKLTPAEKAEKKRRKAEYMTIFVGGKQKRVKRPPMIEGMTEDEFIRANADPVWLHQHEMWEELTVDETVLEDERAEGAVNGNEDEADQESNSA
jgi:hypothetical protein